MEKLSFGEFAKKWMNTNPVIMNVIEDCYENHYQRCFNAYQAYLKEPDEPVLPERWEDLKRIEGYWINEDSVILDESNAPMEKHRNIFATEAQAKSALAMAQLSQLMKKYNGDWEADWNNEKEDKWCITRIQNAVHVGSYQMTAFFLAFKSKETAELFLKRFESLIREYYMM